ncbi:MAG: NAD-binding protein [Thermodesulfobacteriota bacterium]|jgi:trk system potassium uptake protein TrkA|nr:NAD-binding protein [Thermodesulfobacteriota bacterium]
MVTKNPHNIIILGAGSTGTYLAEALCEQNNLILVDKDVNKINQIKSTSKLDILTVSGDAADFSIFKDLDLQSISYFIACTNDDKLNFLTAVFFEQVPGLQTIVVSKDPKYKDYPVKLGCPEIKTFYSGDIVSEKIINLFETPYSWETDKIAEKRILFLKIKIDESSPLIGKSIYSLNKNGSNKWRFLAATEDPSSKKLNFIRAEGPSTRLKKDDIVLVVVVSEFEEEFEKNFFAKNDPELKNVFIVGGSYIASNVAKRLVRRKCNVKLLVSNRSRARELSEELDGVQIILGESTNEELLKDQGVNEDCDYFLALTDDDENNVLSALLSNKLKAKNSLVVYSKSEYQNVINSIGAEREINTKYTVAGEINSYIIRKDVSHETIVDENTKIFEFRPEEDIDIEGISKNIVLAFVIRGDDSPLYISNPEDGLVKKGDYVIAVTLDSNAERDLESKILK